MPTPIHIPALSPQDLGLPPKFSTWRPGQWSAVEQALSAYSSGIRFVSANLPTGSGKSVFAVVLGTLLGGRTVILTSTKGLQDQYSDDFTDYGMVDLRGRQNYPCMSYSNCSDGRVAGCAHVRRDRDRSANGQSDTSEPSDCPYSIARDSYLSKRLTVSNYACYFANTMHGEGMGEIDLLVLDEAHNAMEELSAALTITLDHSQLQSVQIKCGFSDPPTGNHPLSHWRTWANTAQPTVTTLFNQVKRDGGSASWLRIIDSIKSTLAQISTVADSWILDETKQGQTTIAPLWPTDYAEERLFRNVKHVLLLSATIVPKTEALLNIGEQESMFISQTNAFNPRRSPVYLFGACRVDSRMTLDQMDETIARMDMLIDRRLDRKGVIHPVSYDRATAIMQGSRHQGLMIAPKGKMLHDSLELFRTSAPPRLLITPAITTGYDFPGSQCEFQILIKVPFIDARSPILKARSTADPEYLPYLTAQILTQTCGRGMRGPDDQCENIILDTHANWFLKPPGRPGDRRRGGYRHLFPPWFLNQVQYPNSPPVPPAALGQQQQWQSQ